MSNIMRPVPFPQLINWIQSEYKNFSSVFGIRKEKFFRPAQSADSYNFDIFGKKISAPIGPSSGPHTQLSQNILAAFLAGGRYMELKTVQPLDGEELRKAVPIPSINAACEGYNAQWSTELTVEETMEEFIKAWFLCHIFAVEFDISPRADIIFNISAGYSLEGIKSKKIDSYIEGMKNAQTTEAWSRCYDYLASNISAFSKFTMEDLQAIPSQIAGAITISTFYNCPRDEIEKIASYFITEKNMNTYIKLNPTLLGLSTTRLLLDIMGYNHVTFSDFQFDNDFQYPDAVKMLRRLKTLAGKSHLEIGVKLTNTFPVEIKKHELPGNIMYMSGRALYPLSIYTAKKISEAFFGDINISYSGGADFFNIREILETGIKPVTMVTNLLKPGGIERLAQLAQISQEITQKRSGINLRALNTLCESAAINSRYKKIAVRSFARSPSTALPLFNCASSLAALPPCKEGCPLHINIPLFLNEASGGNYGEALKIIFRDDVTPSITGNLCNRLCQKNCTRVFYEDPLQINNTELAAANEGWDDFLNSMSAPPLKTDLSAAIIGAGPAGIAAAVFLRRNGVPVTVYEKREKPFGALEYIVPSFKLPQEALLRDFQIVMKTGVGFVFNANENYSIEELKKQHRFIIIAAGAYKKGASLLKSGQENTIDAADFLENIKKTGYGLNIGKKIAVIGGNNVAIDCARAAKRCKGADSVAIIYRRTRESMSASKRAQQAALDEKITIMGLLSGESFKDGILTCERMLSGEHDFTGRRTIIGTGKKQEMRFDTVISAAGAKTDLELFTANDIHIDVNFPVTNAALESSVPDVYIAGSCRTGISNVINAITDGKTAAADILQKLKIDADFKTGGCFPSLEGAADTELKSLYLKKGVIREAADGSNDAERCLSCSSLCETCADVCPNRANISIAIPSRQILHIDGLCNNCGNCAAFCPLGGKPYMDRITLFSSEEDFEESNNSGFLKTGDDSFKVRLENKKVVKYGKDGGKTLPSEWTALLETISSKHGYLINNQV